MPDYKKAVVFSFYFCNFLLCVGLSQVGPRNTFDVFGCYVSKRGKHWKYSKCNLPIITRGPKTGWKCPKHSCLELPLNIPAAEFAWLFFIRLSSFAPFNFFVLKLFLCSVSVLYVNIFPGVRNLPGAWSCRLKCRSVKVSSLLYILGVSACPLASLLYSRSHDDMHYSSLTHLGSL